MVPGGIARHLGRIEIFDPMQRNQGEDGAWLKLQLELNRNGILAEPSVVQLLKYDEAPKMVRNKGIMFHFFNTDWHFHVKDFIEIEIKLTQLLIHQSVIPNVNCQQVLVKVSWCLWHCLQVRPSET